MREFSKSKGQSAIEYLMTYGWMLLVVAIVGGAIFSTVRGQCIQGVTGIGPQEDLMIENHGVDQSGNLQMTLRSTTSDPVTVENITLTDGTNSLYLQSGGSKEVAAGSTESFSLSQSGTINNNFEGCGEFDLMIEYSLSGFSNNLEITGTLTDQFEIVAN
jgi:hypothetical protein